MSSAETEWLETAPPIPGFELIERVGEGGMGKVYRARQLSLERDVAVKLLNPVQGQHLAEAFHRESRLMASLVHPNLVTVFDCGQAEGQFYIVTEFVRGTTLRPMIESGQPWPIGRACQVINKIANALSYIHAKGILHLDLKPENILCDRDGEPKITDFGLARIEFDSDGPFNSSVGGTLDYSAPEQLFALPTNERTDLFSLAVLAYELLTGELPGRVYESARKFNSRLSSKVDVVLRRGLARSPEDRYATVEHFRKDLMDALQGHTNRRRLAAMVVAAGMLVWITANLIGRDWNESQVGVMAPPAPIQAWILHDRIEQLKWFDSGGNDVEFAGLAKPFLIKGHTPPNGEGLPISFWPSVRPVMVISLPNVLGFVHPLTDPTLGRRSLEGWRKLIRTPTIRAENNYCRAGQFPIGALIHEHRDEPLSPWRILNPFVVKNGNQVAIADPSDGRSESALMLEKTEPGFATQEIGCYQWLSRIPDQAGTVMVLRYRARTESGDGRISVRVQLPLLLPADSQTEEVVRLRSLSSPLTELQQHKPDEEPRQIGLEDWVTPGREWQTFYTVWDWPAHCQDPSFRNLIVYYVGTGKVWVDDIEVFTWEPGGVK